MWTRTGLRTRCAFQWSLRTSSRAAASRLPSSVFAAALRRVDASRLLGRLVEEELEAAGRVLVVDLERRRGLEEDGRSLDLDHGRLDLAASAGP